MHSVWKPKRGSDSGCNFPFDIPNEQISKCISVNKSRTTYVKPFFFFFFVMPMVLSVSLHIGEFFPVILSIHGVLCTGWKEKFVRGNYIVDEFYTFDSNFAKLALTLNFKIKKFLLTTEVKLFRGTTGRNLSSLEKWQKKSFLTLELLKSDQNDYIIFNL